MSTTWTSSPPQTRLMCVGGDDLHLNRDVVVGDRLGLGVVAVMGAQRPRRLPRAPHGRAF